MNGVAKVCLFLLLTTSAFGQRAGRGRARARGRAIGQRAGKNLRATFPFNTVAQDGVQPEDHHEHHEHHHEDPEALVVFDDSREARQRGGGRQRGGSDDVALDIGSIAAAGERCIDKVVMVEETEYDDVVTCKHSYSEKCHTTYTTDFQPQQEEKCDENFRKNCFIEYRKVASEETVSFCHTPIILVGDGEEVCQTVYESACTTRYEQHDVNDDTVECETITEEKCEDVTQGYTTEQKCTKWPVKKCKTSSDSVKKYSPETECKKVPREVCGPGSEQVPGEEECFDRKETVIQEVPNETCNLEPQRECKHVTKLVPLLTPREECVDIPKEVCSRSRTNPRKVQKPVVKKWCYVPTAQSGLA